MSQQDDTSSLLSNKYHNKFISGEYQYKDDNEVYAREKFTFFNTGKVLSNHYLEAKITARLKTSEVMTTTVKYLLTYQFDPIFIEIQRRLGELNSLETYNYDSETRDLSYRFNNHASTVHFSNKIYFTTPSFASTCLMTNAKRVDPLQKTMYQIASSENIWEYKKPIQESTIFFEQQSLSKVQLDISGQTLEATHHKIYHSEAERSSATFQDFFVSKHLNIPYKAQLSQTTFVYIESLNIHEDQFAKHLR